LRGNKRLLLVVRRIGNLSRIKLPLGEALILPLRLIGVGELDIRLGFSTLSKALIKTLESSLEDLPLLTKNALVRLLLGLVLAKYLLELLIRDLFSSTSLVLLLLFLPKIYYYITYPTGELATRASWPPQKHTKKPNLCTLIS
jgi:hypothetical protein